jgi:hypothetical protein
MLEKFSTRLIMIIILLSGSIVLAALSSFFNPLYAQDLVPNFETHTMKTKPMGNAMISLTMPTEIPTNESVDMQLNFLSTNGFLLNNGTVPYAFVVEQNGQIVYQEEGYSEDGVSTVGPEFSDGPAIITIFLEGKERLRPDNAAVGTFSQNLHSEIQGEGNAVDITGTQEKGSQGAKYSSSNGLEWAAISVVAR